MSNSVQPHRRQPTRLPHPWDSPGKNTGVGCHFLLQCMKVKSEVAQSCPTLATPWTAAYQAPPSMGFSRQEYWSGLPLPVPLMLLSETLTYDPSSGISHRKQTNNKIITVFHQIFSLLLFLRHHSSILYSNQMLQMLAMDKYVI